MLNYIWFGMIMASIICALATGRIGALSTAVMDGAQSAVEISISLLGSMCAWLGFLKIAEKSGLSALLAQALSPLIDWLFPEYRGEEGIKGKICMNLSANLLGLGNAATPLGIAAMQAMQEKNPHKEEPTKGMVLFVVMNTASLQLLPVNMAAMRSACGSAAPFGILPEIWVTSLAALVTAVASCRLFQSCSQGRWPRWNG